MSSGKETQRIYPWQEAAMDFGEDRLDEEFPLGDGTADIAATVRCPYCGEMIEIGLDPGGGASQEYVEDCQVCCRPWRVFVAYGPEGGADVTLEAEDAD
jgi:hypothetical protein